MCAARLHATRLGHWLRKEGQKSQFGKRTWAAGDTKDDPAALLAERAAPGAGGRHCPASPSGSWVAAWATGSCRATFYCNLNSLHLQATWEPLQAMLCSAQVVICEKYSSIYTCDRLQLLGPRDPEEHFFLPLSIEALPRNPFKILAQSHRFVNT